MVLLCGFWPYSHCKRVILEPTVRDCLQSPSGLLLTIPTKIFKLFAPPHGLCDDRAATCHISRHPTLGNNLRSFAHIVIFFLHPFRAPFRSFRHLPQTYLQSLKPIAPSSYFVWHILTTYSNPLQLFALFFTEYLFSCCYTSPHRFRHLPESIFTIAIYFRPCFALYCAIFATVPDYLQFTPILTAFCPYLSRNLSCSPSDVPSTLRSRLRHPIDHCAILY